MPMLVTYIYQLVCIQLYKKAIHIEIKMHL